MTKEKDRIRDGAETEASDKSDGEESDQEIHSELEAEKDEMESQSRTENIDDLRDELEKKKAQCSEYYDRMLRLQAEFANFKKRTEKEKEDIYLYANEKLTLDLLDIIDNFERALEAQEDKEEPLYTGVELIFKKMLDTLEKHGVKEIEALNKPFDMNLHHAVMREEIENCESGEVIEVFQKGYMIKDKVLRPAMVKVAQ